MITQLGKIVLIYAVGLSPQLITPQTLISTKLMMDWSAPSNPYKIGATNCSFLVENGFLKEKCLIDGKWYFKCPNSNRFYQVHLATCTNTIFSKVCPNDTTFYQVCGHKKCRHKEDSESRNSLHKSAFGPDVAACGDLICQYSRPSFYFGSNYHNKPEFYYLSGSAVSSFQFECNYTTNTCLNTINNGVPVHKYACEKLYAEAGNPLYSGKGSAKKCDDACDGFDCNDEAVCHNLTIGMFCNDQWGRPVYVSANKICDSIPDCSSRIDEAGCQSFSESCWTENFRLLVNSGDLQNFNQTRRVLSPRSKCSVPSFSFRGPDLVCTDYRDQMNCTGSEISPLVCDVDGHPTTISEHVICKLKVPMLGLCDDKVDVECVEAETGCRIHKHKLCDGIKDCRKGHDEGDAFCEDTFSFPMINCVRKLSRNGTAITFPNHWVLDGVTDCRNNIDEKPEFWTKQCGTGLLDFYVYRGKAASECSTITQFQCPGQPRRMNLNKLCTENIVKNCDFKVCLTARKEYIVDINDKLMSERTETGAKGTLFCLPGLHELEGHAGKCSLTELQRSVYGVPDIQLVSSHEFAMSNIECSEVFGELYVYLACAGLCSKPAIECPLNFTVVTWTCLNNPEKSALSLADDGRLALVAQDGAWYSQEIFSCDNGRCVTFDKVCNLVDNCGDMSDEKQCFNNFKCEKSEEYIPMTSKCDGRFDCFDYTDECNKECNNQVTMFHRTVYYVFAWIFGLLATVLNTVTLFYGMYQYGKLENETAMVNKVFVILITFGDLLQGLFLLVLSIGDKFFNKSTCVTQFEWTTSGLCTFLGVLSTVGSLVSLYSMTILSMIRASKVGSMIRPRETLSRKRASHLLAAALTILLMSTFIAIIPIISFEDFFVENLMYDNNALLIGAPNKAKHLKIVESYFGRIHRRVSEPTISWERIRTLIKEMFTNSLVTGKSLDFYGSNGFCLFSYFVRRDNSFKWFSISILSLNFLCVLIIIVCYAVINLVSQRSSGTVCKTDKNSKKLQRKITVIIMTDILTWVPFIVICAINYTEVIDTSNWYSLFCIFFLRINSIINPIGIYDDTILQWLTSMTVRLKSRFEGVWFYLKKLVGHKHNIHDERGGQLEETVPKVTIEMTELSPKQGRS